MTIDLHRLVSQVAGLEVVGPKASPGHDGGHHQQDAVACDLQELFTPDVGDTSVVD